MKIDRLWPIIMIAASFVFGIAIYPSLPAKIPIHWNASGNIDGWAHKGVFSVFGIPLIMIGMYLLFLVLPKIDPFKKNYEKFADTYNLVIKISITFFAVFFFFTTLAAIKQNLDIGRIIGLGIGALFVALGNLMTRVKRNFFVGFRTPWTIANDQVWTRTHRMGGRLMVVEGIIMMLASLLLPSELNATVTLIAAAILVIVVILYSYLLFRKLDHVELN